MRLLTLLFLSLLILLPGELPAASDVDTISIPVMKNRLRYGDKITAEDINFIDVPASKVRDNVITKEEDLIGKTPRRFVQANRPIREQDITTEILVEKGNMVSLVYYTKYMELKASGTALDSGSKGDVIRVKNASSGKVVQGSVEAAGLVKVSTSREYLASAE